MTALVKPTDAMKEALKQLGASSAEEAIRIYRFDGLLGALAKSANGSSAEFAKMFPNVRGLTGAISIGQRDLELFATNIAKVGSAGAELNSQKWMQATATDAERATAELNRLSNALTVDLGQSLLKATADTFELVGGAETLIDASEASGFALLGVGSAAAIYATKTKLGIDATSKFSQVLNGLSLGLAAVGVAASAGDFLGNKFVDAMRSGTTALEEANRASLEKFREHQQEILRISAETNQRRADAIIRASQDAARAYQAEVNEVAKANQALVSQTDSTLKSIVSAREGYVRELSRAVSESIQAVRDSEDRISDLRTRADDRNFARSIRGTDDGSAALALLNRSRELAEQAVGQLSTAVSRDQISNALETFRRAEAAGEQAESIAQRVKSRELENRAAATLNQLTQRQVEAEGRLQEVQENRRRLAEKERDHQERLTAQLKEQTKILLTNTSLFDDAGKPFSVEQQAQRQKARRDALSQIVETSLSQKDFSTADALGLTRFITDFQSELGSRPLQLQFDIQSGVEDVKQQLTTAFANFEVSVPYNIGELSSLTGKQFASEGEVFASVDQVRKEADALKAAFDKAPELQKRAAALRQEIASLNQGVEGSGRFLTRFMGDPIQLLTGKLQPASDALGTLQTEFANLSKSANITDADLKRVAKQLQAIHEFSAAGIGNAGFSMDLADFSDAWGKLKELQSITQELAAHAVGDDATIERLQKMESFLASNAPAQRSRVRRQPSAQPPGRPNPSPGVWSDRPALCNSRPTHSTMRSRQPSRNRSRSRSSIISAGRSGVSPRAD